MSEVILKFENVMSQNVMTVSYYNIYVTDEDIVFINLDRGIFQELTKIAGPVLAIASVAVGAVQRKKMIKVLREMSIDEILQLKNKLVLKTSEANLYIKNGITKTSIDINGKNIRIKKSIGKKIIGSIKK